MRPDVLVLSSIMSDRIVDPMREHFTVHRYGGTDLYAPGDPARIAPELAARIRGLVTDPPRGANLAVIDHLPRLEIIACFGTGVDHIDLASAGARGIRVTNTPHVIAEDVADLAIGMLIASARRIVAADHFIREGGWLSAAMGTGQRIGGRTLGILGLGQIGSAVAERAAALKMKILYSGPRRKPEAPYDYVPSLLDLAERSDFLMLSCKGGPATRHLVTAEVLSRLGPQGTLVNVARGSVVDEAVLIDALASGRLGAAALDVFENEPRVPQALLDHPRVLVQPHHGSYTDEAHGELALLVQENLRAQFDGRPLLTPVL